MAAVMALQPSLMATAAGASAAPQASPSLPTAVAAGPAPLAGLHVLLVDDEKLSRVVVGNLLRRCNYQVTTVDSGEEALNRLRQAKANTYHLVLTDVMMPVVDGLQVLRFVRSHAELMHIPVVMMSAMQHQDKVFECIKHGAEEYITKPVTSKEVQNFVQHVYRRLLHTQLQPSQAPLGGSSLAAHPSFSQISAQVLENPAAPPLPGALQLAPPAAVPPTAALNPAIHSRGGRSGKLQKVLLAQWLARPSRAVEPKDAFRIFCELLLLVEKAQASGPAPPLRPSRLHLYSDGRIMFAPPSTQSSTAAATEDILYCSPEEEAGQPPHNPGSASFSLGAIFFELFCPLPPHQRTKVLSDLRSRKLPADFTASHPQEAAFTLSLLHPDPTCRPSASELAASDMFRNVCSVLRQRHAALEAQDQLLDAQVLWDFLTTMHASKKAEVDSVQADLGVLDADIAQVASHLLACGSAAAAALEPCGSSSVGGKRPAADAAADDAGSASEGSLAKRLRLSGDRHGHVGIAGSAGLGGAGHGVGVGEVNEVVAARWKKVLKVFPQVEAAFFSCKAEAAATDAAGTGGQQQLPPEQATAPALPSKKDSQSPPCSGAPATAPLPALAPAATKSTDTLLCKPPAMFPASSTQLPQPGASAQPASKGRPQSRTVPPCLATFSEDLGRYAQYSRLDVKASLRYGDLLDTSNMVCSMAFDRDDEFFATAGVNKRIKIFEYSSVMDSAAGVHCPLLEINSRSKLSAVCWSGYIKNHLACSDYEGIVQLWDANTNTELMQFEEHDKRVWSVDFSRVDPTRLLSGSDDGTVKLWSINQDCSVATIDTQANVCSVQFSPDSAHLVALASANYHVYLYDLRAPRTALATLAGHQKAVSYVRFVDGNMLVSASTDNSLRLWDLAAASEEGSTGACRRVFTGHMNEKNFVGLSVTPDGYIACGSETNMAYCYYQALPMPVMSHAFGSADPITGLETDTADSGQFVSSVCWSQKHRTLLAANSTGSIKLLAMV